MASWISAANLSLPSEPGWYPTLSNWRTATLHAGARHWTGTEWAVASDRIEAVCLERFDCAHSATSRAFDLEPVTGAPANTNHEVTAPEMAAAAG